ncbi:ribosome maturation factor RimM [Staphylospora marina]|uniref:ribosome maturation factor RimM n=1 Tax=Staphylospora marina TaxID=2490858 RepID=UPI000F5B8FF2|nr:ribosome maturation factor RimM [Staphylospora marina]
MSQAEYLKVARMVGTHGIRGEVRVLPDTDFPEIRFAPGSRLLLRHPSLPSPLPLTVERSRPHKSALLVKFREWGNINDAEPYKGSWLVVPREEAVPLNEEEGEFYHYQIIGCRVVKTDGEEVGTVKEILRFPANDVWVVRPAERGKDILIPYIGEIVKEVDVEGRLVRIEWMEGLGE